MYSNFADACAFEDMRLVVGGVEGDVVSVLCLVCRIANFGGDCVGCFDITQLRGTMFVARAG